MNDHTNWGLSIFDLLPLHYSLFTKNGVDFWEGVGNSEE